MAYLIKTENWPHRHIKHCIANFGCKTKENVCTSKRISRKQTRTMPCRMAAAVQGKTGSALCEYVDEGLWWRCRCHCIWRITKFSLSLYLCVFLARIFINFDTYSHTLKQCVCTFLAIRWFCCAGVKEKPSSKKQMRLKIANFENCVSTNFTINLTYSNVFASNMHRETHSYGVQNLFRLQLHCMWRRRWCPLRKHRVKVQQ